MRSSIYRHYAESAELHAIIWRILCRVLHQCAHIAHCQQHDVRNFPVINCKATYVGHVAIRKMLNIHKGVLRLFINICKDRPAARAVGFTSLDGPILYNFPEEDIVLMIQISDTFVKTKQKIALLLR